MRNSLWLSAVLLVLATLAFGLFLHRRDSSEVIWLLAVVYTIIECGALSILWKRVRNIVLMGFKSDVGYAITALLGASLVVVILAWIQISSYFLVMFAAALLVRINLFTLRVGLRLSFIFLLLVSCLGLTLSWTPLLLTYFT